MRAVFALILFILFAAGFYVMGMAFNHPDDAPWIFAIGLAMSGLAIFIPLNMPEPKSRD